MLLYLGSTLRISWHLLQLGSPMLGCVLPYAERPESMSGGLTMAAHRAPPPAGVATGSSTLFICVIYGSDLERGWAKLWEITWSQPQEASHSARQRVRLESMDTAGAHAHCPYPVLPTPL